MDWDVYQERLEFVSKAPSGAESQPKAPKWTRIFKKSAQLDKDIQPKWNTIVWKPAKWTRFA